MPDTIHRGDEQAGPTPTRQSRRRSPDAVPRSKSIRVALSEAEYGLAMAAAGRAGQSGGTYAAEVLLAAARGGIVTPDAQIRDGLHLLDRAALEVRRVGTNLNQAVMRLHSTGQLGGDLARYAARADAAIGRLEAAAEDLRTLLVSAMRPVAAHRLPVGPRPASGNQAD